jgi:hypothetical protein
MELPLLQHLLDERLCEFYKDTLRVGFVVKSLLTGLTRIDDTSHQSLPETYDQASSALRFSADF